MLLVDIALIDFKSYFFKCATLRKESKYSRVGLVRLKSKEGNIFVDQIDIIEFANAFSQKSTLLQ